MGINNVCQVYHGTGLGTLGKVPRITSAQVPGKVAVFTRPSELHACLRTWPPEMTTGPSSENAAMSRKESLASRARVCWRVKVPGSRRRLVLSSGPGREGRCFLGANNGRKAGTQMENKSQN